ncbi:MAG TPA: HEAT repeat domain-containing protein [Bryobacteraceae bacterium]|nr:HEAT repeat domain-containing protein [Bryobacteraceae bacterium]
MSGKQAFDRKLEQLRQLRDHPNSSGAGEALRKALRDKSNFVVSKAAAIAGELDRKELIQDLVAAFERFLVDPVKSDPQCWAKNAIVKALKDSLYDDSQFYIRGMTYRQREPSWGDPPYADTAVTLRGNCAFALIECCRGLADLEILSHLTDMLADPEAMVRQDAARALAQLGRPEGALLLRLKIYNGDAAPEVIGQCFTALVSLSRTPGVRFVARYLDDANEDLCFEAAAALGESQLPDALDTLRERFARAREPRLRRALLASIGASRLPAALDFLISLLSPEDMQTARDAVAALAPGKYRDEVRTRVEKAVENAGSPALMQEMRKAFQD